MDFVQTKLTCIYTFVIILISIHILIVIRNIKKTVQSWINTNIN